MEIDYTKSYEQEDSLEILKLKKEHVHIFKLPPMSSAEGHVASDFTELIFKGTMKITQKGDFMIIYFLNPNNTIFLVSMVDENVERFIVPNKDTSRYFSVKAMNETGVPAWYGIGWTLYNISFFLIFSI
jgi:hypothetical protein